MKVQLGSFLFAICATLLGCAQSSKPDNSRRARTEAIDTGTVAKYKDFSQTPAYVKHALDSINGGEFLIANPGEHWNAGCCQVEGAPGRELVWASVNGNHFLIAYDEGGFAMQRCLMQLNFDGENLISFSKDGQHFRWIRNSLEQGL